MTREEALRQIEKDDRFVVDDDGIYDHYITTMDAERLVNRIYDDFDDAKVLRTANEIADKIYDIIGTEAYRELVNDCFLDWLIGK